MNASLYLDILKVGLLPFLRRVYPDGHRFMQDNDPKHTSVAAREFFAENSINWWKTPPESPDANPIENLWHELKVNLFPWPRSRIWGEGGGAWEQVHLASFLVHAQDWERGYWCSMLYRVASYTKSCKCIILSWNVNYWYLHNIMYQHLKQWLFVFQEFVRREAKNQTRVNRRHSYFLS